MADKLASGMQEIVKSSSDLSVKGMVVAGVGTSSGLLGWLGDNALAIGAVCTILGLCLTAFFRTWEFMINRRESKLRVALLQKQNEENANE